MKSFRLTVVLVITVLFLTACPIKNSKPEWGVIETIVKNNGELIQINLTDYCSDPDGNLLSYSLIGGPGTVSGSHYEWTVSGPLGDLEVTIRAKMRRKLHLTRHSPYRSSHSLTFPRTLPRQML